MEKLQSKYKYVLFDLDGTLSESGIGVKKCIEQTLCEMKKPQADLSNYTLYIGPPLVQTFKKLCGLSDDEAQTALDIYIKHYDEFGIAYNRLFDGMEEVLRSLKDTGAKIAVCSSKYEPFAENVIKLLKIEKYFDAICGSTKDGSRKEKEDLIPYAVKTLGGDILTDKKNVVMIGDTYFDAKGARITGVDFIGVGFGYGNIAEMEKEGMTFLAQKPADLKGFLIR